MFRLKKRIPGSDLLDQINGKVILSHINAMLETPQHAEHLMIKNKELIAAALSIAVKCESCLAHHLRRALKKGADARENAETLGVALLMVGVPVSA